MTRAWLMFVIAWCTLMLTLASLLTGCAPYPVAPDEDGVDNVPDFGCYRGQDGGIDCSNRDACLYDGGLFTYINMQPRCLLGDTPWIPTNESGKN